MSSAKPPRDPRGHSLRVYADLYDSPAFKCLSPHGVVAYLALLRELKGYNNGDLSLPLSRAKNCGISHHLTLAHSLRALCAVGLIAITRKGGSAKGGQRLASLYRVTDRECFEIPAKHLTAMKATNEWKNVASIEQGQRLIAAAEVAAKTTHEKKALGHGVTVTRTPSDVVSPKTRTRRDTWPERPGHGVTMVENPANPSPATISAGFAPSPENAGHRTPHVPPLYIATPVGEMGTTQAHGNDDKATTDDGAISREAIDSLDALWAAVGCRSAWSTPTKAERMHRAREAQQRAIDRHRTKPTAVKPAGAVDIAKMLVELEEDEPTFRHMYFDSLTRERDEFSQDTTAWND